MGIALLQLFAKHGYLRVLASQTEHRRAGHIRVMDIARDERAQVVGILARPAASSFVHQKLDSVHVLEKS